MQGSWRRQIRSDADRTHTQTIQSTHFCIYTTVNIHTYSCLQGSIHLQTRVSILFFNSFISACAMDRQHITRHITPSCAVKMLQKSSKIVEVHNACPTLVAKKVNPAIIHAFNIWRGCLHYNCMYSNIQLMRPSQVNYMTSNQLSKVHAQHMTSVSCSMLPIHPTCTYKWVEAE